MMSELDKNTEEESFCGYEYLLLEKKQRSSKYKKKQGKIFKGDKEEKMCEGERGF